MMIAMYRTAKMPIIPNSLQRKTIDEMIECERYMFNAAVTAIDLYYKAHKELPTAFFLNEMVVRIRHNHPYFAKIGSAQAQNETVKRALNGYKALLDRARKEHFKETKEDSWDYCPEELGRLRYRKQGRYHSFTYPSQSFQVLEVPNSRGKMKRVLKLGKVKGHVKCLNQQAPISCETKMCTISRKDYGTHYEYFASVTYDCGYDRKYGTIDLESNLPTAVGVDLGLTHIAALSNGKIYDNPHDYAKRKKDFSRKSRRISKSLPNTEEHRKNTNMLQRSFNRLNGIRRNRCEEISKDIALNHDVIVMENLSVRRLKGISRSKAMTHSYNDASLGTLIQKICQKAESAANKVVFVDPRGTSRACSGCGADVPKKLGDRIHACPYCGLILDRDVNAAVVIKNRGWSGHPFPA